MSLDSSACLAKVKRALTMGSGPPNKPAVLVLSGALNPLHTQHVRVLDVARGECERLGWTVVGGFLAPSSEEYVDQKLGDAAWSLATRVRLCELATLDSDWISVWAAGELSGHRVCENLRKEILEQHGAILEERSLAGVEVMGSDTAIRILDAIASEWKATTERVREPRYRDRLVCCVIRRGPRADEEASHIINHTAPSVAAAGVRIIAVDTASPERFVEPVSSADVRALIAAGDWQGLRARSWLNPRVLAALEATARY